jgi:hypothetical protein
MVIYCFKTINFYHKANSILLFKPNEMTFSMLVD